MCKFAFIVGGFWKKLCFKHFQDKKKFKKMEGFSKYWFFRHFQKNGKHLFSIRKYSERYFNFIY